MFGRERSARLGGPRSLVRKETVGPDFCNGHEGRFVSGPMTQVEDRTDRRGVDALDDLGDLGRGLGNQAIGRRAQTQLYSAPFYVVAACGDDYNPEQREPLEG